MKIEKTYEIKKSDLEGRLQLQKKKFTPLYELKGKKFLITDGEKYFHETCPNDTHQSKFRLSGLRDWIKNENIREGDTISISYDSTLSSDDKGRIPISIKVVKRKADLLKESAKGPNEVSKGGVSSEWQYSNEEEEKSDYEKLYEIKVRLRQSKFRKLVLENFNNRCCISGITEENLLIASHIIPWSRKDKKETRLDPSNGLCLSILYDGLFDKGYFSLSDNYEIIIPSDIDDFSDELQKILSLIKDKPIENPQKHKINIEYIKHHRENIFGKFNNS